MGKFHVLNMREYNYKIVEGKAVNIESIDCFVYQLEDNSYSVHELNTGIIMGNELSIENAIAKVKFAIDRHGIENIKNKALKQAREKYGLVPSLFK